jgi:hypothetical protein
LPHLTTLQTVVLPATITPTSGSGSDEDDSEEDEEEVTTATATTCSAWSSLFQALEQNVSLTRVTIPGMPRSSSSTTSDCCSSQQQEQPQQHLQSILQRNAEIARATQLATCIMKSRTAGGTDATNKNRGSSRDKKMFPSEVKAFRHL